MTTPPRVAIVAASPNLPGGHSVQATCLVEALRADGHHVSFLPIDPRWPRPLQPLRRWPGIRTVVNQSCYLPRLARLAQADVAHVFSAAYASFLLAPVPAMTVARALRKRVVLHYHSGEASDHLARWGALVHPWLRLADQIVVPSDYLRGVFAGHGYDVRVIPNVVDLSRLAYRTRLPLRPRLLSTRNLEPYYRVDVIIAAYARVKQEIPEATLTIAGDGTEAPRLRRMVEDERLAGVRFIGAFDPAAMPRVYDADDIFVNASVVDNQPVSILEAFASGLPVVSTATGDIPAMVRHGDTGLLVPPCDPEAMANAILTLLAHPRQSVGMAARARETIGRYTWPAVRDAWASVYQSAATDPVINPCSIPRQSH